ncbi:MAG: oxidoreductase, partial [Sulfurimonadaceae bacterium]
MAAYEVGAEKTPVATWASQIENPLALDAAYNKTVQRIEVESIPGAFQLLNIFTKDECDSFIDATEALGYTQDASVSLPRSVRHNENLVWVVDDT